MAGQFISIGALSQATGIPAETLRTWERRYAFPQPARTDGGHRLYEMSLIEHLRAIRSALDQGHRPSVVTRIALEDLLNLLGQQVGISPRSNESERQRQTWLDACLKSTKAMDNAGLLALLKAKMATQGLREFILKNCSMFLKELGERWADGDLTISQEHLASGVLEHLLSEQWRSFVQVNKGPRFLLTTAEDETHTLGLQMTACMLAIRGARVLWLGANTPIDDVKDAAESMRVRGVFLSYSSFYDKKKAHVFTQNLRKKMDPETHLVVGGEGAPADIKDVVQIKRLSDIGDWYADQF